MFWLNIHDSVATNTAGKHLDILLKISSGFTLTASGLPAARVTEVSKEAFRSSVRIHKVWTRGFCMLCFQICSHFYWQYFCWSSHIYIYFDSVCSSKPPQEVNHRTVVSYLMGCGVWISPRVCRLVEHVFSPAENKSCQLLCFVLLVVY